jgi:hypothetical protein
LIKDIKYLAAASPVRDLVETGFLIS